MTAAQFRTVQQPLDPTTAVGEIALFDADGNITGGTVTKTDNSTTAITVTTA